MRLLAIVPILLSIAAIILTFLCVFAGSSKDWLETYDLFTLNISRIGQNSDLFSSDGDSDSGGIGALLNNLTGGLSGDIANDLNNLVDNFANSLANEVGLNDFYSIHILDYCEGNYEPGPVPNRTLSKHDIHRNVTRCSKQRSMFTFDPTEALERSINNSRLGQDINAAELLDKIDWPKKIEDGVRSLHAAFKAMFILYCIGIGLSFICLILSVLGIFGSGRRAVPLVDTLVFLLTFLVLGVASAIATAVSVKGAHEINKYGKPIGVSGQTGYKFMGLTWGATAAMFVGTIVWCIGCILPGRKRENTVKYG